MKNTIVYLLVFSFLLQSCHTYKAIDLKETQLVEGKNYQIKQDTKFIKVKLEKVSDSTLTVLEGNTHKDITVSKIKEIKVKEFSTWKTVGLLVGLTLTTAVIIGVAAAETAVVTGYN